MEEVSATELAEVTGGNTVTKLLGKVAKVIPGVNAVWSAYDAHDTYSTSRSRGRTVAQSLGDAAKDYIKGATFYDLWGPTPAY